MRDHGNSQLLRLYYFPNIVYMFWRQPYLKPLVSLPIFTLEEFHTIKNIYNHLYILKEKLQTSLSKRKIKKKKKKKQNKKKLIAKRKQKKKKCLRKLHRKYFQDLCKTIEYITVKIPGVGNWLKDDRKNKEKKKKKWIISCRLMHNKTS